MSFASPCAPIDGYCPAASRLNLESKIPLDSVESADADCLTEELQWKKLAEKMSFTLESCKIIHDHLSSLRTPFLAYYSLTLSTADQ